MKKIITYTGFLFCVVFSVFGQKIRVSGYVLDRERQPIPFASIQVKGTGVGAVANLKGYYVVLLPLTKDSVSLHYTSIGYRTQTKIFPKGLQKDLRLNVVLADQSTEIKGVTVLASRKKQPSMETIKVKDIKLAISPTGGVEGLVATYAGVTQNNELSSQYSVRGGSYDENMVYVNGEEVYRPLLVRSAQQEGLSFVNPDMIQSVNFSAGGFTAEYGDKMSSVLDIRYRVPTKFEGAVELGLQGDHIFVASLYKNFTQITSLRFKDGRSLLKTTDTKGEYAPLYFDAQTYMTYKIGSSWKLDFLGNASFTKYSFKPQTRNTSFGSVMKAKTLKVYFDGQEKDRFLSFYGLLGFSYIPSSTRSHRFTLGGFYSSERETYDISGAYFLDNLDFKGQDEKGKELDLKALATGFNLEHGRNSLRYSLFNVAYKLLWKIHPKHTLKVGVFARLEQVQDRINEWVRKDSAGYNQPRETKRIEMLHNLYSSNQLMSSRFSFFLLDQMSLDTNKGIFNLYPGFRVSYWSYNKECIVSPRILASFKPKKIESLSFRAALGLYYQAPFYKEIRRVAKDSLGNNTVFLNSKIKSQGALHILLGGDYTFSMLKRKFRFSGELYYKYLYHLNPYQVENVKVRYLGANQGRGYVAGMDFKLFGEFVPGVDSWFTLSLLKSSQSIKGVGEMRLPNAPIYNMSLFFQDYFPGFKPIRLSLRGVLSGGLPQFRMGKFQLPAFIGDSYKRIDLGLIYRFYDRDEDKGRSWKSKLFSYFRSVELALDLFNLLDNANISGYYWVTDAFNNQYAVPNYLTRRQLNLRLKVNF